LDVWPLVIAVVETVENRASRFRPEANRLWREKLLVGALSPASCVLATQLFEASMGEA